MPTRRIMELTFVTIVLWDLGKGAIRLWRNHAWSSSQPGSLKSDAADMSTIFI